MISIKGGTATYDTPLKEWVAQLGPVTHRAKTLDEFATMVELTDDDVALLIEYKASQEEAWYGAAN